MRTALAVIVACLLVGGGWVAGQQAQPYRVPVDPNILSGPDIGFRLEGRTRGGGVLGTLMVRLNTGEWVEAHAAPSRGRVIPLESK
jgi:hypothetical protein